MSWRSGSSESKFPIESKGPVSRKSSPMSRVSVEPKVIVEGPEERETGRLKSAAVALSKKRKPREQCKTTVEKKLAP